ncbi:hypothetical protein JYU34_004384 [Plutella xylostella]|uniref:Uncharacterized protein n=1 Tax=Plutella xylostella TaxID=51655 RepID=A0ABQ7QXW1_PLUXY|nr:hypothetical protein JYU34_004384 [Plutella xylostella]
MIMDVIYFNDLIIVRVQNGSASFALVSGTDPPLLPARTPSASRVMSECVVAVSHQWFTFL